MASTVSSFSVGISADVSEMVSGFDQAAMASQQLVSGMNSVGQSMGAVGGGQATSGIGELARVMELLGLRTEDTSRQISRLAQGNERLLKHIYAAKQATREQTQEIVQQKTAVDELAGAKQRLFESINQTAALETAYIDESSEMATLERLQIKMRQMKDTQKGESILGDIKQAEADIERIKEKMSSTADSAIMGGGSNKKLQDELDQAMKRRESSMRELNELQEAQNAHANEQALLQQKIGDEQYRIGQMRNAKKAKEAADAKKEEERVLQKIKQREEEVTKLKEKQLKFLNPERYAQQQKYKHLREVQHLLKQQITDGRMTREEAERLLQIEQMRINKAEDLLAVQQQNTQAQRNMGYAAQQAGFLLDDLVAGSGTRGLAGAIQASANNITSLMAALKFSGKAIGIASIGVSILQIAAQTGALDKAMGGLGLTADDTAKKLDKHPNIYQRMAEEMKTVLNLHRDIRDIQKETDATGAASTLSSLLEAQEDAGVEHIAKAGDLQHEALKEWAKKQSGMIGSFFSGAMTSAMGKDLEADSEKLMALNFRKAIHSMPLMALSRQLVVGEKEINAEEEKRLALIQRIKDKKAEVKNLLDPISQAKRAYRAQLVKEQHLHMKIMESTKKTLELSKLAVNATLEKVRAMQQEIDLANAMLDPNYKEETILEKKKRLRAENIQMQQEMHQKGLDMRDAELEMLAIDEKIAKVRGLMGKTYEYDLELGKQIAKLTAERTQKQQEHAKLGEENLQIGRDMVKNRKDLKGIQDKAGKNAKTIQQITLRMQGQINSKFAEELRLAERRRSVEQMLQEMRDSGYSQEVINQIEENYFKAEAAETRRNELLEKQKKLKEEIAAMSNVSVQDAIDARSVEAGKLFNQSILDSMTTKAKDPQVEELKKINEELKEVEASIKDLQTVNLKSS